MGLRLLVLADPSVPDETALKLSEPRRKSSFDYVSEPGTYFTHRQPQTIIHNNFLNTYRAIISGLF
jgi:hypothetical protein